ncbi:hypothetical protein GE061_015867 [Apolygus lucorum]|uniref:Reverse transcriptase n=1 Tax=Apolygus lucorum TaxID=248454 RepID=A0A8S9XP95_APOLU|nr:hypothetical protein GE061_015867 [Apolygus lucorum]
MSRPLRRYLGVDFMGVATISASRVDLGRALARVTKAPFKPHQKLRLLRTYLLPKLTYGLVFGRLMAGSLQELDREVRSAVRSWLKFPPGVPSAYIHAPVKSGGLGIVSLSASIPSLRRQRLLALRGSSWGVARAAADLDFVRQQLAWCDRATPSAPKPSSSAEFAAALHESVDGKELRQCSESLISSQWVDWALEGIGARDYRHFHAVRVASLPTAVRCTRGSRGTTLPLCRACRSRSEHLYHVVQQCPRTHRGRILRHDAVAKQIAGALSSSGWDVERERLYHMPSDQGKKPNIVAVKPNQSCIILDVQVVNGSLDMEQTWRAKIRKYDTNDLRQAVSELKGVAPNNIRVMAATLSWRGVWCGKSATELRELGISVGVLRGITTRVLLGSYLNWWSFYRGTSLHPSLPPPPSSSSLIPRAGVG